MQTRKRNHWLGHVKQIIRSRHYSWLAEARDGEPIDQVMTDVMADVMHICKHAGVPLNQVIDASRRQFEAEESTAA